MKRKNPRPTAPPAPVTNLSTLPVILTMRDMEAIYRVSHRTIRRSLERNEFHPLPIEKYPYRWRRDDVIRDITGPSRKLKRRPHGFATTKARHTEHVTE